MGLPLGDDESLDLDAEQERPRALLVPRQPARREEIVDPLSPAAEQLGGLRDRDVLARRRPLGLEPLEHDLGGAFGDPLDELVREVDVEPRVAHVRPPVTRGVRGDLEADGGEGGGAETGMASEVAFERPTDRSGAALSRGRFRLLAPRAAGEAEPDGAGTARVTNVPSSALDVRRRRYARWRQAFEQ